MIAYTHYYILLDRIDAMKVFIHFNMPFSHYRVQYVSASDKKKKTGKPIQNTEMTFL